MFMRDPFGFPVNQADLPFAYLPAERTESDRDLEQWFEDLVDAAQGAD